MNNLASSHHLRTLSTNISTLQIKLRQSLTKDYLHIEQLGRCPDFRTKSIMPKILLISFKKTILNDNHLILIYSINIIYLKQRLIFKQRAFIYLNSFRQQILTLQSKYNSCDIHLHSINVKQDNFFLYSWYCIRKGRMGICMKNTTIQNANGNRHQHPISNTVNNRGNNENNEEVVLPSWQINNYPYNQAINQVPFNPIQQADLIQPDPQEGLRQAVEKDDSSIDSEVDEINQADRLEVLRRVSSSGLRQTNSDNMCGICYQKFHIFRKWPMEICHNQHAICDQCVKDFQRQFQKEPFPCPFCRLLVFDYEVKPSKKIFKALNKLDYSSQIKSQEIKFYLFAFQHELYEIAGAYKQNRRKDLKKIEHLDFENKLIQNFPYFDQFKNVRFLQLEHNRINDAYFLLPLSSTLRILNLSYNMIESLDWTSQFTHLEILACQYNNIRQISFFKTFLRLKEVFLIGNKISDAQTISNFKIQQFRNLRIMSIESFNSQIEEFYLKHLEIKSKASKIQEKIEPQINQIKQEIQKSIFETNFPSLQILIFPGISQNILRQVKIICQSSSKNSFLNFNEKQISAHLLDSYFYGNLFQFKTDAKNPHYNEYYHHENKLLKTSSNFTTINSKLWIPHIGKQTLKLKLREKNSNIMIGICTRNIKYSASIYSNQFIGITLWGNIYNKSQSMPINCDLRINDGSIIAMILDFDKGEISWFIDKRLIGRLTKQRYFLQSKQLYFLYGVRDNNIEIQYII